jgi:hypothetical protein
MSSMSQTREDGYVSSTLISLIVSIVFLVGAIGFGTWAFMSRQDYKNNSDQKAAKAAAESKTATEAADAIKYAEEAKNPLKTHKSPDQFGGVTLQYPKTWSAYVDEGRGGNTPVDNYFHPDIVPSTDNKAAAYALRIQVVEQAYSSVVDSFKSAVNGGKLAASPYALPKVPDIVGTRLTGEVRNDRQGSLIILPMRNLTLKIWTEAPEHLPDFDNIILANLTFSP